jgi:hypothetical protein
MLINKITDMLGILLLITYYPELLTLSTGILLFFGGLLYGIAL